MNRDTLRATLTRATIYLYATRITFLPDRLVRCDNDNGVG